MRTCTYLGSLLNRQQGYGMIWADFTMDNIGYVKKTLRKHYLNNHELYQSYHKLHCKNQSKSSPASNCSWFLVPSDHPGTCRTHSSSMGASLICECMSMCHRMIPSACMCFGMAWSDLPPESESWDIGKGGWKSKIACEKLELKTPTQLTKWIIVHHDVSVAKKLGSSQYMYYARDKFFAQSLGSLISHDSLLSFSDSLLSFSWWVTKFQHPYLATLHYELYASCEHSWDIALRNQAYTEPLHFLNIC